MTTQEIKVPNIGDVNNVEVIEVMVSSGQKINKDDSLITLESEKASMEIPSPYEGTIESINVKIGDKVSEGSLILTMNVQERETKQEKDTTSEIPQKKDESVKPQNEEKTEVTQEQGVIEKKTDHSKQEEVTQPKEQVHAGPAVRRMAREFGIDLNEVTGTGPKDRILKEDLQKYVKTALSQGQTSSVSPSQIQVAKAPDIDFSKFGEIETQPLNKIKKLTGVNVHRSWVTIPHVTQFGQADITDMEEFRKAQKSHFEQEGIKLTPLVFIMKAVVAALKAFPHFNASLDAKGEHIVLKKYFNLGIAVDTPNGLVVPVIKEVDKKGMVDLAKELAEVSQRARKKGLTPADMAGSCFTISSLGGIGGTAFTPIINAPDVAILGISKAAITPVFKKDQFVPRLMLPLSLSYDHRVIDGADGARFIVYLTNSLSDIRTLLL